MTDRQQLIALTKHLGGLVEKPAPGKHGDYVNHANINQVALLAVGPHDFEIVEAVRGTAPEIRPTEKTKGWPAREDAVVGCRATLHCWVDGQSVTVTEVGSVENPAVEHDGENLKKAASDAYKRCWMRVGLGLHLWVRDSEHNYFLRNQLRAEAEGPPAGVNGETGEVTGPELDQARAALAAVTMADAGHSETEWADDDPERPF